MGRSRCVKIVEGVKSVGLGVGGVADRSALCREAALSGLEEDFGAQQVGVEVLKCEGCGRSRGVDIAALYREATLSTTSGRRRWVWRL